MMQNTKSNFFRNVELQLVNLLYFILYILIFYDSCMKPVILEVVKVPSSPCNINDLLLSDIYKHDSVNEKLQSRS